MEDRGLMKLSELFNIFKEDTQTMETGVISVSGAGTKILELPFHAKKAHVHFVGRHHGRHSSCCYDIEDWAIILPRKKELILTWKVDGYREIQWRAEK